jgi:hypothetical protein
MLTWAQRVQPFGAGSAPHPLTIRRTTLGIDELMLVA